MGKGTEISGVIAGALANLSKKDTAKEGVDLVEIAKKLSEKKFGKGKKK